MGLLVASKLQTVQLKPPPTLHAGKFHIESFDVTMLYYGEYERGMLIILGHQMLTGYQDGYNFSLNQVYFHLSALKRSVSRLS
jgi:hypothetical protein